MLNLGVFSSIAAFPSSCVNSIARSLCALLPLFFLLGTFEFLAGFSLPPLCKFNLGIASLGWALPSFVLGWVIVCLLLFVRLCPSLNFVYFLPCANFSLFCFVQFASVIFALQLPCAKCALFPLVCAFLLFQDMSKDPPQAPIVELTTRMGQRLCPGWDGNSFRCGKYMSHSDVDPHTLCGFCRVKKYGRQCDPPTITCRQCVEWPEEQIMKYRKKDTYKKRHSESPHDTPSPAGKEAGRGPLAPPLDKRRPSSSHGSTPSPAGRDDGRGPRTPSVAAPDGVSPLPELRAGSSHRPPSPSSLFHSDIRGSSSS